MDSISKVCLHFQVDSKFAGDDFVRGGSSIDAQVENVDSSDSEEEEENGDVGFTFLKQVAKISVFGNFFLYVKLNIHFLVTGVSEH